VALQLEHAAREAATEAVSIESATGGAANAVTFTNRAHALTALARRLARDEQGDEWFWPLVVPGWSPTVGRGGRWVHLMDAAHAGADAPVVAAAVLQEAMRADGGVELLGAVAPGKGAHWLRLEGMGHIAPSEGARPWRPPSVRSAEVVRQWSNAWHTIDDRIIWLATLLTCIERPASIGDPHLPARVASALARMDITMPASPAPERAQPIACERTADGEQPAAANARDGHPPRSAWDAELAHAVVAGVAHDALGSPAQTVARAIDQATARSRPELLTDLPDDALSPGIDVRREPASMGEEGFFSHFAGIYFVVPILERLQFAAFLAASPELCDDGFAAHVLWLIARRAGLPDTDPLARAFEEQCGAPMEMEAGPFVAWVTAIRRWCRRRAGIGLVTVIQRPGRLRLSRTHIEASFALSEVDVRVRRAALDVDPGWVPWLGRVVQFRYGGHDDD